MKIFPALGRAQHLLSLDVHDFEIALLQLHAARKIADVVFGEIVVVDDARAGDEIVVEPRARAGSTARSRRRRRWRCARSRCRCRIVRGDRRRLRDRRTDRGGRVGAGHRFAVLVGDLHRLARIVRLLDARLVGDGAGDRLCHRLDRIILLAIDLGARAILDLAHDPLRPGRCDNQHERSERSRNHESAMHVQLPRRMDISVLDDIVRQEPLTM